MADAQATILRLEHATWAALKRSGKELLPFLSPDCSMIFPAAPDIFSASSEPTLIDILSRDDFKPWTSYAISNERVIDLGPNSKALLYQVSASRGEATNYEALITSVWRKRGAAAGSLGLPGGGVSVAAADGTQDLEWQLVVHQQTPVTQEIL